MQWHASKRDVLVSCTGTKRDPWDGTYKSGKLQWVEGVPLTEMKLFNIRPDKT